MEICCMSIPLRTELQPCSTKPMWHKTYFHTTSDIFCFMCCLKLAIIKQKLDEFFLMSKIGNPSSESRCLINHLMPWKPFPFLLDYRVVTRFFAQLAQCNLSLCLRVVGSFWFSDKAFASKAHRTVANFHILKRCKVLENESSFQGDQHLSCPKMDFF